MNDIKLYETIPDTEQDFPIKVRRYCQSEIRPHWHEHTELVYIIDGKGKFAVNTNSFDASNGETVIANSNELHQMLAASVVDYICIIVNPSVFNETDCKNVILENKIQSDDFLKEIFTQIYEEYISDGICSNIVIKGKIYILIAYLIRNFAAKQLSQSEYDIRIARMRTVNKVLNYIHEHYNEQISTSVFAKKLFISESHLCRMFKQAVGVSVLEYINKFRIDKACVLLKNTNENISDIAMSVGFENLNYFDRIFKRYKNISPGAFRKGLKS